MRHKPVLLFAIVAAILLSPKISLSSNKMDGDKTIPIIIDPLPINPPDTPRNPVFNPFFAYYQTGSVFLGCNCNCGIVDVTFASSSGNYYFHEFFDTDEGSIIIPINGNSVHYTLTITTMDGIVFEGELLL